MERIFKALVGSSAYESVLWEASCIRELFQSVERIEGGRESEARGSIRSRALGVEKKGLRQLQLQERTRSAQGVSLRYL